MEREKLELETLRKMLEEGEPVTVVDIRPTAEWEDWRIPGSINVDVYEDLKAGKPNALSTVDLPADHPVVTICGAGKTSKLAAEQLRERGYDAISLEGGMKSWSLAWNSAEVPTPNSGVRVLQIRRTGKGCLSYLVGTDGEAVVIDPSLEPEVYLALAQKHGWNITGVLETHIHADHLSRATSLGERAGATFYLPEQDRVEYPFIPQHHGDAIEIGSVRIETLHTPGHTPESSSYLLDNSVLFTGDTLFLNGVGRPDLEASSEQAEQRAQLLHRSLQELQTLPEHTQVLPAHTNEPVAFDEQALVASLGDVVERSDLLQAPEEDFVEQILQRIPPTPPNHQRIVELNEAGAAPEVDPTELEAGANRCAVT